MTLSPQVSVEPPDLGTPAVAGEPTARVRIDGREISVPPGTSVLRAASQAGVAVPRLCATDSLAAFGSCRLCLVEAPQVLRHAPAHPRPQRLILDEREEHTR